MRSAFLLLFLSVLQLTQIQSQSLFLPKTDTEQKQKQDIPQQVHAGIVTSIEQKLFEQYKSSFLQSLEETIKIFNYEGGLDKSFDVGIIRAQIALNDFRVNEANFDQEITDLKFIQEENSLNFSLRNVSFNFAYGYSVKTDPLLFDEQGTGLSYVQGLDLDIIIRPYQTNGIIQFDLKNVSSSIQSFGFNMKGGDLSEVINYFNQIFEEFIKQYMLGNLQDSIRSSINQLGNEILMGIPTKIDVEDGSLEIDYALVNEGIVISDKFISILFDGTFHPSKDSHQENHEKHFQQLPVHDPNGKSLQIMISEYVINSLMLTVTDLKWYEYTFYQNSDSIDAIVDGFEEAFGDQPNCTIIIEASENFNGTKPEIEITDQGSTVEIILDFHIKNPLESSMDAVVIIVKTVASISFKVDNDMKLYGSVNNIILEALDFTPFFKTKSSIKTLDKQFNFAKNIMEAYINQKLDKGIVLPVPQNITKFIKQQTVVSTQNGYLLVEGEPEFLSFFPEKQVQIKQQRRVLQQKWLKPLTDNLNKGKDLLKQGQDLVNQAGDIASALPAPIDLNGASDQDALNKFYDLVNQTYYHKLSSTNGSDNTIDIYDILDMIANDVETGTTSKDVPAQLKEQHAEVVKEFKQGKLKWKDIQRDKIQEISKSIEQKFLSFKDKQEKAMKKAQKKFEEIKKQMEGFAKPEDIKNIWDKLMKSIP